MKNYTVALSFQVSRQEIYNVVFREFRVELGWNSLFLLSKIKWSALLFVWFIKKYLKKNVKSKPQGKNIELKACSRI